MSVRVRAPSRRRAAPRADLRRLRSSARALLRALERPEAELSIALVDDDEMRALNARWRGIDRSTDVLSFSLLEGAASEHRGALLGDVVIALPTALRQAARRRATLDAEIERLLIHGLLHLLGYDHVRVAQARAMRAEERRLQRVLRASTSR